MAESREGGMDARTKALGAVALIAAASYLLWRCSTSREVASTEEGTRPSASAAPAEAKASDTPGGVSAPIAASHVGEDVVVAALDVAAKAVRVQRIGPKDEIVAERIVLDDVSWSTDAELKLVATPEGVGVTWRGLRAGRLVRQLAVLGPDLQAKGEVTDVAAASCATRGALWFSDGVKAVSRPWRGAPVSLDLPRDADASLLCGEQRAFALLEEEESTSLHVLAGDAGGAVTVVRERDFGEDEQRELAPYTVGDDVGFVRLGASGAIALREMTNGELGPLRRLKRAIPKDDDVVAVDASPRAVVIVYTEDVSETYAPTLTADSGPAPAELPVCTKVAALRVDRQTFEESTLELSPGRCGHEVGPFFTGVVGEAVEVTWAERAAGPGTARAPIVGLAHVLVAPAGTPRLSRVEQAADTLADAGCDGNGCSVAALVRRAGAGATAPGVVKVLRYR